MVNVCLILKVGRVKNSIFTTDDEYDLVDFESINEILEVADPISDRAVLLVHVNGWPDDGRTLCSYKRIKVKTKNGSKYRWIVTN